MEINVQSQNGINIITKDCFPKPMIFKKPFYIPSKVNSTNLESMKRKCKMKEKSLRITYQQYRSLSTSKKSIKLSPKKNNFLKRSHIHQSNDNIEKIRRVVLKKIDQLYMTKTNDSFMSKRLRKNYKISLPRPVDQILTPEKVIELSKGTSKRRLQARKLAYDTRQKIQILKPGRMTFNMNINIKLFLFENVCNINQFFSQNQRHPIIQGPDFIVSLYLMKHEEHLLVLNF
ncbi:unnamed protein product [Moneuplotes crassus]|uniref:Uncharacterized protein n=1 Tax=Euplotes crassus TaxID=5936 RepID=A0AAD1UHA7_EUPCR|nr:unnamed protein product [Moneuplotes crassus]